MTVVVGVLCEKNWNRVELAREVAKAREENARLRDKLTIDVDYWKAHAEGQRAAVEKLTRERDDAREMRDTWHTRAEAHRQATEFANAEVARLEGLILKVDDQLQQRGFPLIAVSVEARRIRAQREEGR